MMSFSGNGILCAVEYISKSLYALKSENIKEMVSVFKKM